MAYSRVSGDLVKLNLTDKKEVTEFMRKEKPNYVFHCAAERHPDIVNYQEEKCRQINVESVETLAKLSTELNCCMLYVSTDYVFDGTNPPYKTTDKRNPLNKYGKSKADGEDVMNKYHPHGIIVRVGVLYGITDDLEESACLRYVKNVIDQTPCQIDNVQLKVPTLVDDIGIFFYKLMKLKEDEKRDIQGIYHFTAEEKYSHYQMCLAYGEVLGMSTAHITPQNEPPPKTVVRPQDSTLDLSKTKELGIYSATKFKEGLVDVLKPWKKN